jgi:protein-disulfide isomerase
MSDAQAFARIESELKQSRVSEARRRFVSGLRTAAGVKILLEPPRVIVDTAGAPLKGSPSAPVTIVEFSDFQCPYCREATQTLKRLEQQYGNKVRVVFRDFPLPMHKDAPKASEAAACANEQGQFWPMHDKLFENQSSLQVPDLKRRAADIGLNTSRFDDCLDSGKYAGEWQRNRAIGQRYGVSATPTFFINGRMVLGALPFQAFTEIVDDELGRSITRAAER